jgi:hypothetical protein
LTKPALPAADGKRHNDPIANLEIFDLGAQFEPVALAPCSETFAAREAVTMPAAPLATTPAIELAIAANNRGGATRPAALGQADTPPSFVFNWIRFLTAPLRALSPTGLFTAIIASR